MTDELTVEGKQYVSSKRASETSHYAQDYVGQLARGGLIDAERVGGLWYVQMESLLKYKEKAESYVPRPPQHVHSYNSNVSDALVSFGGKDYVSASRAAEITGYHQDYVGQLAREGKILSRQIGNRWYVDREGLLKHKEEKDRLLGAVQAQAVGIQQRRMLEEDMSYQRKIESLEPWQYRNDEGALMPALKGEEEHFDQKQDSAAFKNTVPIRIVKTRQEPTRQASRDISRKLVYKNQQKVARSPRKTMFYAVISVTFFTAIAFSVGMIMYLPSSRTNLVARADNTAAALQSLPGSRVFKAIGDTLEPYITHEIVYKR